MGTDLKEEFINSLAENKNLKNLRFLNGCSDPVIDLKVATRKDVKTVKKLVSLKTKAG